MACRKRKLLKAEADFVIRQERIRLQEGSKAGKIPVRSYRCNSCRAYHVTSQPTGWVETHVKNPPTQPARGGPGVEGLAVE